MKTSRTSHKLFIFFYLIAVLWFCHHFIFRPVILDWGATAALCEKSFSGDLLTNGSKHTRAVLVDATPEEIWPWLIQLGQERGGFYSYQWLENVFRADMKNVYTIQPELQSARQVGDTIWLANKEHYNGQGYQILAETTPLQSFVMVGGEDYARLRKGKNAIGSWAIYLYPEGSKTWLIARSSGGDINLKNKVLNYFFFEVPHFIMERKMLLTVKRLAEGHDTSAPDGTLSTSH